ncbi:hypothetical protein BH11CYA1_BH11CYA1_00860 [soil metagenome]
MANLESVSDANVAPTEAPKPNNLSEVATDLMSAHAHRPGLAQEDLAKATDALHASGTLADLSIIGLDGKDLIARDGQGQTLLLDSNNPENQQVLASELTSQPIGSSGRTAELAADGSGKYTVVSGDSCWRVANDILTSQGVEAPNDNQIANYIKELETTNGRSFDQLQIGDEIIIPTKIQGGESTHFAAPESSDPAVNPDTSVPGDATVPNDAVVPELSPEAAKQKELDKFGIDNSYALMAKGYDKAVEVYTPGGPYNKPSASLDDITNALNSGTITANERLGLGMLQTQFDYIKNPEDGTIHPDDLVRAKAQRYEEIDAAYARPAAAIVPDATAATDATAEIPAASADSPELTQELDYTDAMFERFGAGYLKAVQAESPDGTTNSAFPKAAATLADISNALTRIDLSDDERHGLQMLESNFDLFKNPETGTISSSDLLKKRDETLAEVRAKYAAQQPAEQSTVAPEQAVDPTVQLAPDQTLDQSLAPGADPASFVMPDLSFPDFNTSSIYEEQDLMAA